MELEELDGEDLHQSLLSPLLLELAISRLLI